MAGKGFANVIVGEYQRYDDMCQEILQQKRGHDAETCMEGAQHTIRVRLV